MHYIFKAAAIFLYLAISGCTSRNDDRNNLADKPNVVIFLSDDQGNADAGYQRSPSTISTPAIDQLASEGIVFTNGYASAYVCAPTRAGLLTGRYQQRFGFYKASDSRQGMPLEELTIADVLRKEGYRTSIFGKWHLGLTDEYHPLSRGFEEFYGFLGHGAHDYYDLTCNDNPDDFHHCIYRNRDIINDKGYLTDNLAREACSFIRSNASKDSPFFLYLPFNAVHWPLQAPEEDINRFNSGDPERNIQLAMIYRMDIAVGEVIRTLISEGVYKNTVIFYFSDNGGAAKVKANNAPLRDFKQSVYEGGIRVPFIMSWPSKIQHSISDEPVISLDIMPTVCDILGIDLPRDRIYDGKSLMSIILGKSTEPLHKSLFWDGDQGRWAVRQGEWKLVSPKNGVLELYNLKEDLEEKNELIQSYPDIADVMKNEYYAWRGEMAMPMNKVQ